MIVSHQEPPVPLNCKIPFFFRFWRSMVVLRVRCPFGHFNGRNIFGTRWVRISCYLIIVIPEGFLIPCIVSCMCTTSLINVLKCHQAGWLSSFWHDLWPLLCTLFLAYNYYVMVTHQHLPTLIPQRDPFLAKMNFLAYFGDGEWGLECWYSRWGLLNAYRLVYAS